MTRTEFIEANMPFYHITPTRNIQSILNSGLKNGNGKGICVVRTNNPNVVRYLVETMLIAEGDRDFSIIEIFPREHELKPEEIFADGVVEITNPIHNYIKRDSLTLAVGNVLNQYTHPELGIFDLEPLKALILEEVDLRPLDI